MTDRICAGAVSALLLLMTAACTTEGTTVQTDVPASAEPFDVASLNGKAIEVATVASGDFSVVPPRGTRDFRVVGKTIIFGGQWQASRCVIKGQDWGWGMAILFTPGQPRSNVKVPCEGMRVSQSDGYDTTSPSDVVYSSTVAVQGNTLELTGELHEHHTEIYEGRLSFTVTDDVTEHLHATFRLAADKCQVLDFSWTTDLQELNSPSGRREADKRSERATGCSIVAAPS